MTISEIEKELIKAAKELVSKEALSTNILNQQILSKSSFGEMLAATLAQLLGGDLVSKKDLEVLFLTQFRKYPSILTNAASDLEATKMRDPACSNILDPVLFFKGFQGLQAYRTAHTLWNEKRTFPAKMLQSIISQKFGMDLHPAAKIGCGILIDHATNIVVGETAKIGNNVSIFHGVTLGGSGNETGDRHPKIGDGVMLGAHAQLLGNIRIGRGAKIGAGAVVLKNVPPHTTFAGVPAVQVGHPENDMPSLEMQQDFTLDSKLDPK